MNMKNQDNENDLKNVKNEDSLDLYNIKNLLPKKKPYNVILLSSFLKSLKEDKFYLICFIITVIAFFVFSTEKVKQGESVFASNPHVTDNSSKDRPTNNTLDEELDVSKYVGTYVKSFKLNKSIKYSDTCDIKEYDFIYTIDKNNIISKYFYNKCLGTLLISKETLSYVKIENTKNIGTKTAIYVFKDKKLTHMNGYTYKLNNEYNIKEENNENDDFGLIVYDSKVILYTSNELYLINGKEIETEILNKGTLLSPSLFRVKDTSDFKYIVYEKDETQTCYIDSLVNADGFEDKNNYSIYSIKFDEDNLSFSEPVVEVVRKRSDKCDTLEEDLKELNE